MMALHNYSKTKRSAGSQKFKKN